jgi:E3 ubiquitin-protein ligase BRE1
MIDDVVTPELLIYQNKQLHRQIVDFRKQLELKQNFEDSADTSVLISQVEDLTAENQTLKMKLLKRELVSPVSLVTNPLSDDMEVESVQESSESVEISLSERQLKLLAEQKEEFEQELDSLRKQLSQTISTASSIQTEFEFRKNDGYMSVLNALKTVHDERLKLRSEIVACKADALSFRAQLHEEAFDLSKQLSSQSETFQSELFKLHAALAETSNELSKTKMALQESEQKQKILSERASELEPLITGYKSELHTVQQDLEDFQVLKEKYDALRNETFSTFSSSSFPLDGSSSDADRKLKQLKDRLESEREYNAKLKEHNRRLKESNSFFDSDLWESKLLKLNELLKQKEDLQNKLTGAHLQLQQQLRSKEELIELQDRKISELEKINAELFEEIQLNRNELSFNLEKSADFEKERIQFLSDKELLVAQLLQTQTALAQSELNLSKQKSVFEKIETEFFNRTKKIAELERQRKKYLSSDHGMLNGMNGGGVQDQKLVDLELAEYRRKIKCSICNDRDKDVTITKCYHCFCRTCVDGNLINARNRKCPLCGLKFSESDIKPVHLVNN